MKRNPLTLFIAFILIVIFGLLLFVYEVRKSESAVVLRFGKIDRVQTEPGPGLCWPWPIEKVYKMDQRVQNFEGKYEQFKLPDQNIIFLSVYVGFRIEDPRAFFGKFTNGSIAVAEMQLEDLVRSAKNEVAGQHPFSDFVSTDQQQMKFAQIEDQILQKVRKQVTDLNYGLDMKFIQIRKIGLPDSVTQSVFDRMTSERQYYISQVQSQGLEAASRIKSEAESQATITLSDADAQALKIRGEGEAQMMTSLAVLQENPALASFNMQITALDQLLKSKSTLVLDSSSSPLQWLHMQESTRMTATNAAPQGDGVSTLNK
jgi:modulator of FtsH protease HflC